MQNDEPINNEIEIKCIGLADINPSGAIHIKFFSREEFESEFQKNMENEKI